MSGVGVFIVFWSLWSLVAWALFSGFAKARPVATWTAWWAGAVLTAGVPGIIAPLISGLLSFVPTSNGLSEGLLVGPLSSFIVLTGFNPAATQPLTVFALMGTLWICGLLPTLAYRCLGLLRLGRIARAAVPALSPQRVSLRQLSETYPTLLSDDIDTPLAVGFTHRKILIPRSFFDDTRPELQIAILRHEICHLDGHDPLWSFGLELIADLLWFAPWMRALCRRWRLSCEIQADAAALADASINERQSYAALIVKTMRAQPGRLAMAPALSTNTANIKHAKTRLNAALKGTVMKPVSSLVRLGLNVSISAMVLAGVGLLITSLPVHALSSEFFEGRVSQVFGHRNEEGRVHNGIDLAAPLGTAIGAPSSGVVIEATKLYRNQPAWGHVIVLESEDGLQTLFAHVGAILVKKGDGVQVGQVIGEVGVTGKTTGPHVHIETRRNGALVDPGTVYEQLSAVEDYGRPRWLY